MIYKVFLFINGEYVFWIETMRKDKAILIKQRIEDKGIKVILWETGIKQYSPSKSNLFNF